MNNVKITPSKSYRFSHVEKIGMWVRLVHVKNLSSS